MIAHRLQTIMTADNLLYLESPTNVIGVQKGTSEYTEIMNRLKKTNYAHQADNEKDDDQPSSVESNESEEEIEKAPASKDQRSELLELTKSTKRRESKAIQKELRKLSTLTPAQLAELKAQEAKD